MYHFVVLLKKLLDFLGLNFHLVLCRKDTEESEENRLNTQQMEKAKYLLSDVNL